MEKTTELRLAYRQQFAQALLKELVTTNHPRSLIKYFCNRQIKSNELAFSIRNLELSVMGFVVKRKLRRKGLMAVVHYLEMLEDCFTDCKVPLN